jgi:hypothetical protein
VGTFGVGPNPYEEQPPAGTVGWQDGPTGKVTYHNLNCARLQPHADDVPANPCSCGADPTPLVPARSLDDVSGEEWNKASAVYRDKIQARSWARTDAAYQPEAPVGSPVDSERSDAREGEVRTTSATGGQKGVKLARYDLIPPEALKLVAEHYGKGAEKYAVHNWRKGFEWSKSYASLQRHAQDFWAGEELDEEGLNNLAAVVFHALTLLTFTQEQPGYDDRFKKGGEA